MLIADYLELSSEYKTTSSFIIANKSNGTRTILTYRLKRNENERN